MYGIDDSLGDISDIDRHLDGLLSLPPQTHLVFPGSSPCERRIAGGEGGGGAEALTAIHVVEEEVVVNAVHVTRTNNRGFREFILDGHFTSPLQKKKERKRFLFKERIVPLF